MHHETSAEPPDPLKRKPAPPDNEVNDRRFSKPLRLPRLPIGTPGSAPGLDAEQLRGMPAGSAPSCATCIDYCPERATRTEITDTAAFLDSHRPEWSQVRWIDVDGMADTKLIGALTEKYHLHPLAVEDMMRSESRTKAESYDGDAGHLSRLFIVARMIYVVNGELRCEQISFFMGRNTLLTFQETPGDVWNPVRQRIFKDGSRLRKQDVSYLLYTLIDALVDQCFPVLDHYSDRLEALEAEILQRPDFSVIHRIHRLKHELLLMRRSFWPMREMIHSLQRMDHELISEHTVVFLRDVYDHSVQVIDLMETYREVAIGLTETYMNAMSNRMNEIMKVLTVIATIFMPLSFVAGVFGMNFANMPELHASWTYPLGFWTLCGSIALGMLIWFRRSRWL